MIFVIFASVLHCQGRQVIVATLHQAGWRTPKDDSEVDSASAGGRASRVRP